MPRLREARVRPATARALAARRDSIARSLTGHAAYYPNRSRALQDAGDLLARWAAGEDMPVGTLCLIATDVANLAAQECALGRKPDAAILLLEIAADVAAIGWASSPGRAQLPPELEPAPAAPAAKVWTTTIPRAVPSANQRLVNQGPTRHAYKKLRDEWTQWIMCATFVPVVGHDPDRVDERVLGNAPGLKATTGRRGVNLERRYGGRAKEMDRDNLVGGMKLVVDAMVKVGLLLDDSPAYASITYTQRRTDEPGASLVILITEDLPC